jgi:hypothetical protein
MSRSASTPSARSPAARPRSARRAGAALPEPPEASFWLERTPLALPRRAAAPAGPARAPRTPPGTVCPKCDAPLSPSEPACPSCGLRRAMFGRYRVGAADRVPAALEALWQVVEAGWSDPALHERFLAQVSLAGAYAYAASRYRRAARARRSDAIAAAQLERISRMVHAVMAVSAVRAEGGRGARPYRGAVALLLVLVALGGLGSVFALRRRGAVDPAPAPATTIVVRRGRSLGPDGRPAPAFGGLRASPPPAPAASPASLEPDEPAPAAEPPRQDD